MVTNELLSGRTSIDDTDKFGQINKYSKNNNKYVSKSIETKQRIISNRVDESLMYCWHVSCD